MINIIRLRYDGEKFDPAESYKMKVRNAIPELKTRPTVKKKIGGFNIDDAMNFDDLELLESSLTSHRSYYKRAKIHISSDVEILDMDNLMEFRHKVQLATGIPLFRQHLFYITDKAQPIYYKIIGELPKPIDIREIEGQQKLAGIPIGGKYNGTVVSYENFTIVNKLFSNDMDIYLVDLDDFLTERVELDGILSDKFNSELIYESFIMPYFPMLTIELFHNYVQNQNNIHPALSPSHKKLKELYENQNKLYTTFEKTKSAPMLSGITNATLLNEAENELNLRNIFDLFKLSSINRFMQCRTMMGGQMTELRKNFNNAPNTRERVTENSLMITIELEYKAYHQTAYVVFDIKGNMHVRTGKWRDDLQITQDVLYDILENPINDVIKQINSHGRLVSLHPIIPFSRSYSRIVNVNLSLFYKETIGDKNFSVLQHHLAECVSNKLFDDKPSDDIEFYIRKGIFRFNPNNIFELIRELHNSYSYLYNSSVTSKWTSLYEKNRLLRVQRRYTDIRFELYSVREEEQYIIKWVISKLMGRFDKVREPNDKAIEVVNKLRKLRQIDPVMYDSKDASHGDDISKKCQKPHQPDVYTPEEFSDLGKDPNSPHIMKYFNATTNGVSYYECNNPNFPFPRFLTGFHPQKFCIPCCKKTSAIDLENKRKDIHEKCLVEHKYDPEEEDDKRSRYVVGFKSVMESGRLAYLPPNDIGILFYKNEKLADEECQSATDNMMVGVPVTYGEANMGVLYSVAYILNVDIEELFEKLIGVETTLSKLYGDKSTFKLLAQKESITPWNDILLDALDVLYTEIRFIVIDYVGDPKLDIQEVHDADMYLRKNIGVIIKRDIDNVVYHNPVVFVNKDEFFNNGTVMHRIYDKSSWLYKNMIDVVNHMIVVNPKANRNILSKYLGEPNITIFTSLDNIAYAVYFQGMYIPILQSYYSGDKATTKLYDRNKQPSKVKEALKYAGVSNEAVTSIIKYHNKVIGVVALGMNWYGDIGDIKGIPVVELKYDPMSVNAVLGDIGNFHLDPQVNSAFHNVYEYDLVKNVVFNVIHKNRNKAVREKLYANIKNNDAMLDILRDYPDDLRIFRRLLARQEFLHGSNVKTIIDSYSFGFDRIKLENDYSKLIDQITRIIEKNTKHVSKFKNVVPENYLNMDMLEITKPAKRHAQTIAQEIKRYGSIGTDNIQVINELKFKQNSGEKIFVFI
jgi:hypothetical protein